MRYILLAIALVSNPAAAADQFDLVCQGKKTAGARNLVVDRRYRIDLAAKRWCAGECPQINDIAMVDDNVITMTNDEQSFRGDFTEVERAYRGNGVWVHVRSGASDHFVITGKCEPAAFTGFPEVNRKF